VPAVQLDAKHRVWKRLGYLTLDFDYVLLRHRLPMITRK
jgi:hypothetical protein